jgi:predicted metal-dependent hydrolase
MARARQLDEDIARAQLRARVQALLDKWQPILGVKVREFHLKKMMSWGSINPREMRMWISTSLEGMSNAALEYVVVHELMHLVDDENGIHGSGHEARFYALMDWHLPTWRRRHARLRSADGVIAHPLPRPR